MSMAFQDDEGERRGQEQIELRVHGMRALS
jgi:hypothetical protein